MNIRRLIKNGIIVAAALVTGMVVTKGVTSAASVTEVAINATNFPDSAFRAYISASFDSDKNGILSAKEIDAVTSINVRGRNITNMTGLAYFSALKSLNCSSNNISSLAVGGNTALTYLNASNNNLKTLVTSSNTLLRTLICNGNNITSLSLANNPELNYVDVSDNEIATLDFSKCKAIAILNVSDNQLVNLNLKGNTTITTLIANANKLVSLNLSENKVLTSLNVADNRIVSLNLSANNSLTTIDCSNNELINVTLPVSVETLACSNNDLYRLDVTALASLKSLDVSDNYLYNLDVSANKELASLNASGNRLGAIDIASNSKLKAEQLLVANNRREVYMNYEGEVMVSEAGIIVDRITSIATSSVVTGQALTADVSGAALIVKNPDNAPDKIDYSYNMGNDIVRDFELLPILNKRLMPDKRTVSVYLNDSNESYPLYVNAIGGADRINWAIGDSRVATIDGNGILKPVSTGTTTVTASAIGVDAAVFTINVYKQPAGINVANIDTQYYTGKAVTPEPMVKDGDVLLVKDKDYTLSYENNIEAGTAIVTIKGCGDYSFVIERRFDICYNIATLTASAIPDQIYTGSAVTPDVSVKNGNYTLVKDKDYTLSYMNNVNIGTGIVTITGIGRYAGVKIQSFNICVPQVTNLVKSGNSQKQIVLKWDKVEGATGYRVYKYNPTTKKYAFLKQVAGSDNCTYTDTGLTAGTNYRYRVRAYVTIGGIKNYGAYSTKLKTYTKFKKVSLTAKAGNKGSKKAILKWKKISGVTGYRVYMKKGTGKFTKIKEIKGSTKVSYTKTKLSAGKTYYFKVRAFKTVDGKNIYGTYSTIKTVIAK